MSDYSVGSTSNFANPSSPIGNTSSLGNNYTSSLNNGDKLLQKSFDAIKGQGSYPWDGSNQNKSKVNSDLFRAIGIQSNLWNAIGYYQLLVIDTTKNNSVVNSGSSSYDFNFKTYGPGISTLSYIQTQSSLWQFNLPINPQQLTITDQYAINTTATLRGVLEEHNGIKFKMISINATMGVWPFRTSTFNPSGTKETSILESVFGGTISAANDLINSVKSTINTFQTGSPNSKPVTITPDQDTVNGPTSTGYYQAMYLQQFLEQYAEAKKNPKNAGWRLVFLNPKQNTSYVVTPMQFTWQQNVNKPMEIQYQLQLKAWRRVTLGTSSAPIPSQPYVVTPGLLQRILNTITEARLTMSAATALIGAVRSDVNGVFSVISQTALFVKDALGVVAAASDLPSSIAKDFSSAIQEWTFNNKSQALAGVSTAAGAAAVLAVVAASTQRNGITQQSASNGQLGNQVSNAQTTNAAANIFNNSNSNADYLDQVPVNQLNLNTAQQKKLNTILSNTSLTVSQLKENANTLQTLAQQLADYFGAGSPLYNSIYNLTPPTSRIQPMTINEFLILDTLYELIQSINILTATTQVTDQNIEDSLAYVAGLANRSGIDFNIPNSKVIVPVPSNTTIEGIAARYLGDPTRWIEIATLNKLEEPYIDYDGFQLPLLSNAIGRQITVSSKENLYFGQSIILRATGQIQVSKNISNITALPNNTGYLITLDGEPNLSNFTLANNAYVQAYLPNTVNAMQKIYIPSDLDPAQLQNQLNVPLPQTVSNSGDPLAQISGVDWLLDDSGDLVIDAYGNFQLAYGMTNIVQALRTLFTTTLNSVIMHPEYGVGISPGTSISDIDIQQLATQIDKQIKNDPRFTGVSGLQLTAAPPSLTISVSVTVANQTGVFPVSFELSA